MTPRVPDETTRRVRWGWTVAEGLIVILAVVWVARAELWALLLWEGISVVFLAFGAVVVWRGSTEQAGSAERARAAARWAWVMPLIASAVGATSAVMALTARNSPRAAATEQVILAIAASVGVVVSWTILHVGFAEIYRALDESEADIDGIEFPGHDTTAFMNYLYFAFTIGTAFATSDALVRTLPIRRIVLIHSVVSFIYNALVVATAIQVLQQLVAR